jgi:heptose I phosphotransferase
LESLAIATVRAAGFGVQGRWPHQHESFIITEALQGMIPLNELMPHLATLSRRRRALLVRRILQIIAHIARTLHRNGLNHRDFYLIHFLVRNRTWTAWTPDDPIELHLIDLHRMQIRARTPRRAAIRDISGLMFSALDCELTMRDWIRFLAAYFDEPRRTAATRHRLFTRAVVRRAQRIYQSEHGKSPRLPAYRPSFA